MSWSLSSVINALKKDPMTRRAFLPIFNLEEDIQDAFDVRIPCSLGYWFYFRQGKLNMTYLLRSSDFSEHFNNDIYLADRLKCFVAEKIGLRTSEADRYVGQIHVVGIGAPRSLLERFCQ